MGMALHLVRAVGTTALLWGLLSTTHAGERLHMVYGVGNDSCGKWSAARKDGSYYEMANWVAGYITAVDTASPYMPEGYKELRKTDADAYSAWLDNYCKANPLETLAKASMALVAALATK